MLVQNFNDALRHALLCFMLIALSVIGTGLADASVSCLNEVPDHAQTDSASSETRTEDTSDCKHTHVRICCAHGGFSSLSAAEPVAIVLNGLGFVYFLRADPPPVGFAPAPELAPPRSASA